MLYNSKRLYYTSFQFFISVNIVWWAVPP